MASKITVVVHSAVDLPSKDASGSDAYVNVKVRSVSKSKLVGSTKVVASSLNPFWGQHFEVPLIEKTTELKFSVYDKDVITFDDYIGEVLIDMKFVKDQFISHGPLWTGEIPLHAGVHHPKASVQGTLRISVVDSNHLFAKESPQAYRQRIGQEMAADERSWAAFREQLLSVFNGAAQLVFKCQAHPSVCNPTRTFVLDRLKLSKYEKERFVCRLVPGVLSVWTRSSTPDGVSSSINSRSSGYILPVTCAYCFEYSQLDNDPSKLHWTSIGELRAAMEEAFPSLRAERQKMELRLKRNVSDTWKLHNFDNDLDAQRPSPCSLVLAEPSGTTASTNPQPRPHAAHTRHIARTASQEAEAADLQHRLRSSHKHPLEKTSSLDEAGSFGVTSASRRKLEPAIPELFPT